MNKHVAGFRNLCYDAGRKERERSLQYDLPVPIPSPLGMLTLSAEGEAHNRSVAGKSKVFWFNAASSNKNGGNPDVPPGLPLAGAVFLRKRSRSCAAAGTSRQRLRQAVWALLQEIPYGQTTTYGALTKQLQSQGIAASPQAVGGAVGHNPISILIPCHRVVGSGGSLTGLCRRH